jgi:glycosyltransferase involved in cell wall biosynthesis
MEYMSCGKVTVCLDLLESRRTAAETAIFVETDDAASYAEAIERTLDDEELRSRLGTDALKRISQLDWRASEKALIGTYEKLSCGDWVKP